MDLKRFLSLDYRYGEFDWDFTFTFALSGLASALEHTHELHLTAEKDGLDFDSIGYHYDVRPSNILVDKHRFVLADFGLGTLKSCEEESATLWKGGAGDYFAPECMDASFQPQRVGRGVDVWAFGCLIAEVVTFMERGSNGVFYDPSGQLKHSVRHWLEELGTTSRPSTTALLQIALDALEPDPNKRPRMPKLRQSLVAQSLICLYDALLGKLSSSCGPITWASHGYSMMRKNTKAVPMS